MIWIGGLVLAVALYLIGPDRFFDACLDLIDGIDIAFRNVLARLGAQTYGVLRALTIAIYVVFAVLAVLASQRGRGGIGALLGVTIVLLMLVWRPYDFYPAPISRWLAALALVVAAAVVMTQRLTAPPMRRPPFGNGGPPPPYPPGGRMP
jgi:amino acid permease